MMDTLARIIISFLGVFFLTRYLNGSVNDCGFILIAGFFTYGIGAFDFWLMKQWLNYKK